MKPATKYIVGLFLLAGGVLQDPSVASTLAALALTHPHIAVLLAVIGAIATALHNPKIEKALGVGDAAPGQEKEDK